MLESIEDASLLNRCLSFLQLKSRLKIADASDTSQKLREATLHSLSVLVLRGDGSYWPNLQTVRCIQPFVKRLVCHKLNFTQLFKALRLFGGSIESLRIKRCFRSENLSEFR